MMGITFDNESTKRFLAKYGRPAKVFGTDVDKREAMKDEEAEAWFDQLWELKLERAVSQARRCDIDFVREKVPYKSQDFINEDSVHKEFTLAGCMFIAQLPESNKCNQLWFIPSSGADPRTIYVSFETLEVKAAFVEAAENLGWKPDELGEKLLLDFLETVSRKDSRSGGTAERWGIVERND